MPDILAHLYYASKTSEDPAFLYGAIFPDNFIFLKKKHITALKFARKLAKKKPKYKLFYQGVKNHIKLDNKFHKKILPNKLKKVTKKFNISEGLAHSMLEIAIDSNIHKDKKEKIKYLLKQFHRFNNKEVIYYLSSFLKKSESFINKAAKTLSNWVKLSTKFNIKAFKRRVKLVEKYFEKEFKKNIVFAKDLFKLYKVWKYSKQITKDYEKWL